jgi:hypothetical protein
VHPPTRPKHGNSWTGLNVNVRPAGCKHASSRQHGRGRLNRREHRLRSRGALQRLEPDEGKLSSPVLRGGSGSNAALLPDKTHPQKQVHSRHDSEPIRVIGEQPVEWLASAASNRAGKSFAAHVVIAACVMSSVIHQWLIESFQRLQTISAHLEQDLGCHHTQTLSEPARDFLQTLQVCVQFLC